MTENGLKLTRSQSMSGGTAYSVYVTIINYTIIKPPKSGELCEEITEFVVAEDHLSPQDKDDLPRPQTK